MSKNYSTFAQVFQKLYENDIKLNLTNDLNL